MTINRGRSGTESLRKGDLLHQMALRLESLHDNLMRFIPDVDANPLTFQFLGSY